jgi:hypothetical protein
LGQVVVNLAEGVLAALSLLVVPYFVCKTQGFLISVAGLLEMQ